jgi:hypothetical protein
MMLSDRLISVVRTWQPGGKPDLACASVRRWLPGYLDGALPDAVGSKLHVRIAHHLDRCLACRADLEHYQELSRMVMGLRPVEPPDSLAVSIRVAVSQARAGGGLKGWLARCRTRLELLVDHVVEPLLFPVTGGALVALIVFGFVFPILGGGLRLPGARPDLPTSLMQPARLQTLAGFPLPGFDEIAGLDQSLGLLVEATVNADGQAVEYRVIGSPLNAGMQRQLDRVVLFSRFRPRLDFGRPTSGGRVVLGFSRVLVRG